MRELKMDELEVVSGGATSLLDYRASYVHNGHIYTHGRSEPIGRYHPADAFALGPGGSLVPNPNFSGEDCKPNTIQAAGFSSWGDHEAYLNGYGHTRVADGGLGALAGGIFRDFFDPGCPNSPHTFNQD